MSGKIKEYVNKKILLYSLKSGQHRTMLLESEKKRISCGRVPQNPAPFGEQQEIT
jgi:hypothetical protein